MLKRISHIGIVVKDLEKAKNLYHSIFGLNVSSVIVAEEFKVNMLDIDDMKLELLEPVSSQGPVAKFLEERGEGIHHICYEVDDIKAALEALAASDIELIDKEPRPGAEGKIAFINPRSTFGVLIELVEKND